MAQSVSHPLPFRHAPQWSYDDAFSRNRGLISEQEQQKLRNSRVAIAGMGGIGGIDAVTLARMGVGAFTIADNDTFSVANTNRQYGAFASTVDRPKVEVMAETLRDINPEVDLRVFEEPIGEANAEAFLDGADCFIDAIEVFSIGDRRPIFREAARRGIHAITAGPVGFSGIWVAFDPDGMSFDRYFDLHDGMSKEEMLASFVVGIAPRATQRTYIDMSYVDLEEQTAPSCALACQIASGAMACQIMKVLLQRGPLRPAPWYQQFDAYTHQFVQRRLWGGNRNPLQRLKRRKLLAYLSRNAA